jgi:hypothetical protein
VTNPLDASRSHFSASAPQINHYSQVENTEFNSSLPAFSSKFKEDCIMRRAGYVQDPLSWRVLFALFAAPPLGAGV